MIRHVNSGYVTLHGRIPDRGIDPGTGKDAPYTDMNCGGGRRNPGHKSRGTKVGGGHGVIGGPVRYGVVHRRTSRDIQCAPY